MTQAEIHLIEEGWATLVERLGLAEATRFVMLLDRRTGGALQHIQHLWSEAASYSSYRTASVEQHSMNQFEAT